MPKPKKATTNRGNLTRALATIRKYALTKPEAVEEFPWGESAMKVKKKVFLFSCIHQNRLLMTVKLPETGKSALTLPFAEPCGYGLGKSGWVTSRFAPGDRVPLDMLKEWIDESYRAIAPAKLQAQSKSS